MYIVCETNVHVFQNYDKTVVIIITLPNLLQRSIKNSCIYCVLHCVDDNLRCVGRLPCEMNLISNNPSIKTLQHKQMLRLK